MRILFASAFALSVVVGGHAMAEPVTLDDAQLDGLTAGFGGFSGITPIAVTPIDTTPPAEPVDPDPIPIDTQPYIGGLTAYIVSQLPSAIGGSLE